LLLVTAATNISVRFCYSILEILAGDVCFVYLFRSDLPVVPTESDVLLVCRQHNDKEWKFKEQHAKNVGKYSRPRGFNIAGASAPVAPAVPTPLISVILSVGVLVE